MIATVFFYGYVTVCFLIFLFGLYATTADLYSLFWRRVTANVERVDVESTRSTEKMSTVFFKLHLRYRYQYEGNFYESSRLNSLSSVISTDKSKIDKIQSSIIKDGKIQVYVFPYLPNISFAVPYWHAKILPKALMLFGAASLYAILT